jgi:hypothetical protein
MKCEYWTYSAGLGDLALDLNEPDLFKQSPSASESRSAKPSSESIGRIRQSTTTCKPSQQIDLEELISSAAGFHASRGPLPGSNEAQKMTVTSGRSWLPLLKSYGLDGSLGKMCEALLTRNWASSAAFLTWKASAIKPSHLLFQLAPSMPRTDATGSGLWLTPRASDIGKGESNETFTKRMGDRSENVAQSLPAQVNNPKTWPKMWPTPTAHLHKEGGYPAEYTRNTPTLTAEATQSEGKPHSSGSLNPAWVEWLMGFPQGWTDLKPSETPSSRKSLRK